MWMKDRIGNGQLLFCLIRLFRLFLVVGFMTKALSKIVCLNDSFISVSFMYCVQSYSSVVRIMTTLIMMWLEYNRILPHSFFFFRSLCLLIVFGQTGVFVVIILSKTTRQGNKCLSYDPFSPSVHLLCLFSIQARERQTLLSIASKIFLHCAFGRKCIG